MTTANGGHAIRGREAGVLLVYLAKINSGLNCPLDLAVGLPARSAGTSGTQVKQSTNSNDTCLFDAFLNLRF